MTVKFNKMERIIIIINTLIIIIIIIVIIIIIIRQTVKYNKIEYF